MFKPAVTSTGLGSLHESLKWMNGMGSAGGNWIEGSLNPNLNVGSPSENPQIDAFGVEGNETPAEMPPPPTVPGWGKFWGRLLPGTPPGKPGGDGGRFAMFGSSL